MNVYIQYILINLLTPVNQTFVHTGPPATHKEKKKTSGKDAECEVQEELDD